MSCLGINSVIFFRVILNDFSKWKQVIKTEQNSNYSNGKYIYIYTKIEQWYKNIWSKIKEIVSYRRNPSRWVLRNKF